MPLDETKTSAPLPLRGSASTPQFSTNSFAAFSPKLSNGVGDHDRHEISSTAISSPSGGSGPPPLVLSSSFENKASTEDFLKASQQLAASGGLKNSTDDLALTDASLSPPVHTVPDARLSYRKWRTGIAPPGTSPTQDGEFSMSEVQGPDSLSRSPYDQPGFVRSASSDQTATAFLRSPEQLPRIAEKVENVPLFANSYDPDSQARDLSEKLASSDAATGSPAIRPQGGSFGKSRTPEQSSFMKKARSYQGLDDLEKNGYFPSAPKPSALGVQRGLKDSVMNDMCRAVVKHMVGDVYVSSSGHNGTKKVLNHLYEPVLQSVQIHFRRLPARYALSVNPDDVPMHMRLLAKHQRNPDDININVQLNKDDDGNIVTNVCDVVVVSKDRDSLLDAITRALTGMKGSILDADVMTTHDAVTLDRFVVKGSFMSDERQIELKRRILENLSRMDGDVEAPVAAQPTESPKVVTETTVTAAATESDAVVAEKLAVMKMVDKNDIKEEWRLKMSEIKLDATVGSGRSGNTYAAWWRGTKVAAKVVDSSAQNAQMSEELLNEFHREVAVVSKLRHPNIVLFLGAAISPPKYCLVFEFMQNGTLTDMIRSRKAPFDFFRMATEMAMGMNYLHLCSIMHRDLKSGNVLIDAHGTVKISDFGLSCVLDISGSHDLTAETGTYRWMAPEVIRHEPYSTKADVYSFGVVLWEMIAKDQPFRGLTPIQAAFAVARQQMRPALPRHTPQKIGELVEHCWHQDPSRRPDFAAILEALPLVKLSLKKRDFKNLGFTLP